MNHQQTLHRILRKAIRPLRRRLQAQPTQATLEQFTGKTLVLIAHPDDEVFCSGLIRELLTRGHEVQIVSFTRGEGGERGPRTPEGKLAQIRVQELTAASKVLGVSQLTFLEYVDPPASKGQLSEPEHDSSELLHELEALVANQNIKHLVTHGSSGEYWHPAHLCLHHHARLLHRRLPNLQLWTFNAWSPNHPLPQILNQDDPTHFSLHNPDQQTSRLQSLACHRSQEDVFQRFANGSLDDFISLTSTENYRKW